MTTRSLALATMLLAVFPGSALTQTTQIPARTNDNLIVAAYNIQWLGQRQHDNALLAQVIEHFDVCGIIEVKDEREVAALVAALEQRTGQDWGYVFGVRTHRPGGRYHEAYAAVWRKDRVELGDGIVSGIWDMEEAFRNDPYIVSFKRREFDFALLLVHTRWSNDAEGTRAGEVAMLAEQLSWMSDFLAEGDFLLAGDFNYAGTRQEMQDMAEAAGLVQLDADPRSTIRRVGSGYTNSRYDHIYAPEGTFNREFVANSSNTVDVIRLVFGNVNQTNTRRARSELSDHLPIFAVFDVSLQDDD